ncbi:3-methyl-2-oxobutanoate hydroxymethyltransferase [Leptolyngbya sp. 15MV]|nr:3-methyl-2-oxobutanoate hydroxymethyltransferase [Leptolyngbya sp. 15MV]
MSTTFQLDTATSRANPTPAPMKRLTVPMIRAHKANGTTKEPLVMLTAYTARQAQLLDAHCDILLVGDSLGQVIYGLPSTIPVTLEMMANHAAAVVRGSYHAVVVVDMPFGSYEASKEQAFASASRLLKESGAAAVKLEGGAAMADTVAFLNQRGIPVMGHVGLTPQAVNVLGGYMARGRSEAEADKIVGDASMRHRTCHRRCSGRWCEAGQPRSASGDQRPSACSHRMNRGQAMALKSVGNGSSASSGMTGAYDPTSWTPPFGVRRWALLSSNQRMSA